MEATISSKLHREIWSATVPAPYTWWSSLWHSFEKSVVSDSSVWQDVWPQYTQRRWWWWSVVWVGVEDSVTPGWATSSTQAPESPARVVVVVVVVVVTAPGLTKPNQTMWPPILLLLLLPSGGDGGVECDPLAQTQRQPNLYLISRYVFLNHEYAESCGRIPSPKGESDGFVCGKLLRPNQPMDRKRQDSVVCGIPNCFSKAHNRFW